MAVLGCIADDFTGASDAASFLVKGGMSVLLYNGIPNPEAAAFIAEKSPQAMVIALKSRTQERDQAVEDSLRAAEFLKTQGVEQFYFKYCSTFDSTPEGNIGPVADALMEWTGVPYSILCPALPANGRTVEDGRLFVNGVPLGESSMRNHPLTPMWDSRIQKLMESQSRYPCLTLKTEPTKQPFYWIPDYRTDEDGARIAERFGDLKFLTGGSGLLEHLARRWVGKRGGAERIPESSTEGKAILLAGSCSRATLEQIEEYQKNGLVSLKLDPQELLENFESMERIWEHIKKAGDQPVLIYSSDKPVKVRQYQVYGKERVAAVLEQTQAALAVLAVQAGYKRIIVAGGETSGAVTKALGFSAYEIAESVAPGVPVMIPMERPDIRLVLKSGNFGQRDFFLRALERTRKSN